MTTNGRNVRKTAEPKATVPPEVEQAVAEAISKLQQQNGSVNGTVVEAPADTTNWKAEAEFWQLKYFEQLIHSTQIISALSRPLLTQNAISQLQAQAEAARAAANQ